MTQTLKQRRDAFIAYALSKGKGTMDEEQLILEAGAKFDKENERNEKTKGQEE